ncbi:MAG: hypothetical protein K0S08_1917 [Gammaproteobacteria bacterium]|jgi:hypothetical protein|nr:hypothetical protein [Gammaproteobacteria bacterium]
MAQLSLEELQAFITQFEQEHNLKEAQVHLEQFLHKRLEPLMDSDGLEIDTCILPLILRLPLLLKQHPLLVGSHDLTIKKVFNDIYIRLIEIERRRLLYRLKHAAGIDKLKILLPQLSIFAKIFPVEFGRAREIVQTLFVALEGFSESFFDSHHRESIEVLTGYFEAIQLYLGALTSQWLQSSSQAAMSLTDQVSQEFKLAEQLLSAEAYAITRIETLRPLTSNQWVPLDEANKTKWLQLVKSLGTRVVHSYSASHPAYVDQLLYTQDCIISLLNSLPDNGNQAKELFLAIAGLKIKDLIELGKKAFQSLCKAWYASVFQARAQGFMLLQLSDEALPFAQQQLTDIQQSLAQAGKAKDWQASYGILQVLAEIACQANQPLLKKLALFGNDAEPGLLTFLKQYPFPAESFVQFRQLYSLLLQEVFNVLYSTEVQQSNQQGFSLSFVPLELNDRQILENLLEMLTPTEIYSLILDAQIPETTKAAFLQNPLIKCPVLETKYQTLTASGRTVPAELFFELNDSWNKRFDEIYVQFQLWKSIIFAPAAESITKQLQIQFDAYLKKLEGLKVELVRITEVLPKLAEQANVTGINTELENQVRKNEKNVKQALEWQEYLQPSTSLAQQSKAATPMEKPLSVATSAGASFNAVGSLPATDSLPGRLKCIANLKTTFREDIAIFLTSINFQVEPIEKLALIYLWQLTSLETTLPPEAYMHLLLKGDTRFGELLMAKAAKYFCLAHDKPYIPKGPATGLIFLSPESERARRELKDHLANFMSTITLEISISFEKKDLARIIAENTQRDKEYPEKLDKLWGSLKEKVLATSQLMQAAPASKAATAGDVIRRNAL